MRNEERKREEEDDNDNEKLTIFDDKNLSLDDVLDIDNLFPEKKKSVDDIDLNDFIEELK